MTGASTTTAAARYAFSARPGFVSSWFRALADRPTSSAPESERVRRSADEGDPDELEDAGRAPRAQVREEAALLPAPAVVGEPDRGDQAARAAPPSSRRAARARRGGSPVTAPPRAPRRGAACRGGGSRLRHGPLRDVRAPAGSPRRVRLRVRRRSSSASLRRSAARAERRPCVPPPRECAVPRAAPPPRSRSGDGSARERSSSRCRSRRPDAG